MKILVDYNEQTGVITTKNGLITTIGGAIGFEQAKEQKPLAEVLEMLRSGTSADDLVKLKAADII